MSSTAQYKDALKKGQKEHRACRDRGEYPYLPALTDFISEDRISAGTAMGVKEIPAEYIIGTRSAGRTQAFARNFMPLMPETSEFAGKWRALCDAHLDEGIRDPIKVFEYRNRYYVAEGNKRVSILKYFGAPTVLADVTRVWPLRDGDKAVELYYELVDFERVSGVNFLEFTKSGGYAQLQKLLGKAPQEAWTEEERRHLSAMLHLFRQAYDALGGQQLSSTVGDALLAYLRVYGADSLTGGGRDAVKTRLAKIWDEIALQQEETPLGVRLEPAEEKKVGLLDKVLFGGGAPTRAAFLHDRTPETSAWTASHEAGRLRLQQTLGDAVETCARFNVMEDDPEAVIEEAVAAGNKAIFTTSPVLLPATLRAAVEHPEIAFFNCSIGKPHRYIRTYYPRMYEAKFVIGAVAGSLAGGNGVGYICDYPIYGQVAGINAFALGVQMVNPRIKVYLEWSSVGGAAAAVQRLRERGVSLISSRDLVTPGDADSISFGLSLVNDDGQVQLAMPKWQWGVYYETLLRQLHGRSLSEEYGGSPRALNYYWGMNTGVVDVSCTEIVPAATVRLTELLKGSIVSGVCNPFHGPLYANDGRRIEGWDDALSVEQIIGMDWLNDNVEGEIPAYDELNPEARPTVDMAGVDKVIETKKSGTEG